MGVLLVDVDSDDRNPEEQSVDIPLGDDRRVGQNANVQVGEVEATLVNSVEQTAPIRPAMHAGDRCWTH